MLAEEDAIAGLPGKLLARVLSDTMDMDTSKVLL